MYLLKCFATLLPKKSKKNYRFEKQILHDQNGPGEKKRGYTMSMEQEFQAMKTRTISSPGIKFQRETILDTLVRKTTNISLMIIFSCSLKHETIVFNNM